LKSPTSPLQHIVILGGGYAGLTAAQRLRKLKVDARITLIDAKPEFQERIRLNQVAAGQPIPTFQYRPFLETLGVEFLQARVTALDPAAAALTLQHPSGAMTTLPYDYLIYALGSVMDVDKVPGVREHAHAFSSVEAAIGINKALSQTATARVLVVGGGLTGIETAAELAENLPKLHVTLAMDKPFSEQAIPGGFNKRATDYLYQAFEQRNIRLRTGARVKSLKCGVAEMSDGKEIEFDVCIWTSGFVAPPLARVAGIQVNQQGSIVADASLRSLSHPNIIAIGDAAQASSDHGGYYRMGCATALAMAPAGARTLKALLAGKVPPKFRFVYLFRNISLGRHDGVVQFVDRADVPRSKVWTGTNAARWKEFVCQSTLSTVGLSSPEKLPVIPPLRMVPQLLCGQRQYA
jgi:NADH dehydrogenase FAD-containing subunit